MLDTLSLRFATPEDVSLILQLIRDLASYEKLEHEVVASEDILSKTLFGERPYAEVIIAESLGEPLGFALFFHNFSTFLGRPGLYLEDLYVKPEGRGKGIGKALLKRLAEIALERNCRRMEWWVLDWNKPSIEFYESIGAVAMDEWTVYRMTEQKMLGLLG